MMNTCLSPRPRSRSRLRSTALAVLVIVPGCAAQRSDAPSLLPRPIESRSAAEPLAAPPAVAQPDPALDTRIAAIVQDADTAATGFATAAARAETRARAARGAAVGTDRWIEAQSALAELDVYRAQSSATLTDLEELAIDRAAQALPDYPALDSARAAAQMRLDAQTDRIARLQALLPDT